MLWVSARRTEKDVSASRELNGSIMHAQPIYANYGLKPFKFVIARLVAVKVIINIYIFFT